MKKILVFCLLLVFIYGCTTDPLDIAKQNPKVEKFLNEYPDAEIHIAKFTKEKSELLIEEIRYECRPSMEPKDYHKITIIGPYSTILTYIDADTELIECTVEKEHKYFVEKCRFPGNFDCVDKALTTPDSVTLMLRNNYDSQIIISDIKGTMDFVECRGAEVSVYDKNAYVPLPAPVPQNEIFYVFVGKSSSCGFTSKDNVTGEIILSFKDTGTELKYQAAGTVASKVE